MHGDERNRVEGEGPGDDDAVADDQFEDEDQVEDGVDDDGVNDEFEEFDERAFLDDAYEGHAEPTPIRRFEASAAGAVAAAYMNGLRNALFGPPKEEVQIVADWSGDPPFTDPYVLRLDPEHPEDSIVMVRPWLRDAKPDRAPADDARAADRAADDEPPSR